LTAPWPRRELTAGGPRGTLAGMKVNRGDILVRGLANRCPNCGGRRLFRSAFQLHPACPDCGLDLERGEGFFLGSMSLNYGMTLFLCLLPILLLWVFGILPGTVATAAVIVGAIAFPVLFYRSSRSWWLAIYFAVLPQELPANRKPAEGL